MPSAPLYEVTLHSPADIFFTTYILSGLYELHHQGVIRLKQKFTDFARYKAAPEIIDSLYRDTQPVQETMDGLALYTVKHLPSGKAVRFGTDLNDAADLLASEFIQQCELVFKRHYQSKYIRQLAPPLQARMHPAGLSYGLRSVHEPRQWLLYAANFLYKFKWINDPWRIGRTALRQHFLKPWRNTVFNVQRYRNFRTIPDFEQECQRSPQPVVLFQTRCWKRDGKRRTNKHNLNEYRAQIIRQLRQRLGERFMGGFIPDDFARQHYPDCLTSLPTDPRAYIESVKQASIVIYTQGVIDSPAWKLGEYLAAAKCIVAEPLTAELPRPFVPNEEIIFFTSAEECVQQCIALLDNPERIRQMSCSAQAYYRAEVEPSARVLQMLEKATGVTP